jgi:16S rRNA (cytidine1402-2'-O)-methyltransferase
MVEAVDAEAPGVDWEPVLAALLEELPLARAVKLVCKATGAKKNAVYERALALRGAKE